MEFVEAIPSNSPFNSKYYMDIPNNSHFAGYPLQDNEDSSLPGHLYQSSGLTAFNAASDPSGYPIERPAEKAYPHTSILGLVPEDEETVYQYPSFSRYNDTIAPAESSRRSTPNLYMEPNPRGAFVPPGYISSRALPPASASSMTLSPASTASSLEPTTPSMSYYPSGYAAYPLPGPSPEAYLYPASSHSQMSYNHPAYQPPRRQSMPVGESVMQPSMHASSSHPGLISDYAQRRSLPDIRRGEGRGDVMPYRTDSPLSQAYTPPSVSDADSPYTGYAQLQIEKTADSSAVASATKPNKPLYSHREQLQFFKDAVLNCPMASEAGPFIPQMMYKPHTTSDRRRYVEEIDLDAPIYFWVSQPTECGLPLVDALHSRVKRLQNRDECVFEGRGPSVSIRLEWPGYRQWSRQIPTKDFRSPPGPITRAKLAKNVAKCVQRFIAERANHPEPDSDPRWRLGNGPNQIKFEDLILVSIHHVSMGSWQPQLRLRRPLTTPVLSPAPHC